MLTILFFTDTRRDWQATKNWQLALERKHIVHVRRATILYTHTDTYTRGKVILRVISSSRNSYDMFSPRLHNTLAYIGSACSLPQNRFDKKHSFFYRMKNTLQ